MVSFHRVLKECPLSSINSTFDISEVQDGFVCVADLETFIDGPCDVPSGERAFFFSCSFFLNEDSSFEVSVEDLLETTRYLWNQEPRRLWATWHSEIRPCFELELFRSLFLGSGVSLNLFWLLHMIMRNGV